MLTQKKKNIWSAINFVKEFPDTSKKKFSESGMSASIRNNIA